MTWLGSVLRRSLGDTLLHLLLALVISAALIAVAAVVTPAGPGNLLAAPASYSNCFSTWSQWTLLQLEFTALACGVMMILVSWHAFWGMRMKVAREAATSEGVAKEHTQAFIQRYLLASSLFLLFSLLPVSVLLLISIECWIAVNAVVEKSDCWIRINGKAPYEATVVAYIFSDPIFTAAHITREKVVAFLLDLILRGSMIDIMEHFQLAFSPLEANQAHKPFLWLTFFYRFFVAGTVVRGLQYLLANGILRHFKDSS